LKSKTNEKVFLLQPKAEIRQSMCICEMFQSFMGSKYDGKVFAQIHYERCELKIYLKSLAVGEKIGCEMKVGSMFGSVEAEGLTWGL
jgi:hypothetical protein